MTSGRRSGAASQPASHPLSAAVVGAGTMGRHHARVLADLDSVRFVGVADPDEARARALARRYSVPWFADFRILVDELGPDFVSVAVPTRQHRLVGVALLERGVNVLMEKPLAATAEEALELISAARQHNLTLGVDHLERFNPAIAELKRRLTLGEAGRIFHIRARRHGPFPERVKDTGVVIDLATHDIDVIRWLNPAPVRYLFAETARRIHREHEDFLLGILHFDDGAVGLLDVNWLTPTKIRELVVTGERGMFTVDCLTQDLYFYANESANVSWEALSYITGVSEGTMLRPRIEKQEPLRLLLQDFVEAIIDQRAPMVTAEDGLAAIQIAIDLVKSGDQHRVVPSD